ncbi:hypothetical protein MASR1M32_40390 [Rhodobacter sp.]
MTKAIGTERRWLRSVIAASAEPLPIFPWMRGQRKRPAAMIGTPTRDQTTVQRREIALFGSKGAVAAR